jgi:hypothetical protein
MGDESREATGQLEAEVPLFAVTVDPHFAPVPPQAAPSRPPVRIGWHECCVHWATATEAEKLEHLPTGEVLLLGREFQADDDRHAALVQLDAIVRQAHRLEQGQWSAAHV